MKPVTAIPPAPTVAPVETPAREQTTADVLIAAKALIEDLEKWGQGSYTKRPGTRCAGEALCHAGGGWDDEDPAKKHLEAVTRSAMEGTIWDHAPIVGFNDTHTHAEVMAAFDRAIYRALEFDA